MTDQKEMIIGIDLGTTNSLAAAVFDHGPEALAAPGPQGPDSGPLIPSVVTRRDGTWLVGHGAQGWRTRTPKDVIFSVKRLMGHGLEELREDTTRLPYGIEAAQRGMVRVVIGEERYTPQEISAEILKTVKARAEAALGRPVNKAVITVPAYFDDTQRQATRDAGRIAGLDVVRIINEPTAAAIAYGLDETRRGLVAVYDLGGGTFDISILHLDGQVFQVLATHGNTHLGGDDLDHTLAAEMVRRVKEAHPGVRLDSLLAGAQFNQAARQVKIALSTSLEAPYTLEFPEEGLVFSDVFTVEVFNRLAAPLVGATLDSCRKALAAAGKAPENMDEVVLVGGSTRIPLVRHRVEMFFNKKPHAALNPDEVVALGAAVQGHLLAGGRRDYVLLDVVPLALGLETLGGTFTKLITANTTIPAQAAEMFTTSADNQTAVELNIYQGEREFVKDCRNLGRFKLRGIPPMAAGLPRVNVTFLVDANGILTVSALEERSGKEAAIEVVPSHGLTNDEVERMMEESFQHATEDLTRRQMVEFSQMAEAVFAGIRKVWPQAQRIMSEPHQQAVHKQMDAVRESMGGSDPLALKAELDKLGGLTRPLADAIISQAATMELKRFLTDHGQE